MSEFHDDYPQYELMAHHSEEEGKVKRKKLWRVFWIMLAITLVELVVGFKAESLGWLTNLRGTTLGMKMFFIIATIAKAGYIVLSFMHLGDEKKAMKWMIIAPYSAFIVYLAVMVSMGEGTYTLGIRSQVDPNVLLQSETMKKGGAHGHDAVKHEGTEEHKGGEEKHEGEEHH